MTVGTVLQEIVFFSYSPALVPEGEKRSIGVSASRKSFWLFAA